MATRLLDGLGKGPAVKRRSVAHPQRRKAAVAKVRKAKACWCQQRKPLNGLGEFSPPVRLSRGDAYALVDAITLGEFSLGEVGEMGSWLSKAFKKVTGTNLSNVVGPIAGVVGAAVGGPVGGAIGGAIGGAGGGGGSSSGPGTVPGTIPGTVPGSTPTDVLRGVADIFKAMNTTAVNAAAPRQQTPARAASTASILPSGSNAMLIAGVAGVGLLALLAVRS